MTDLSPLDTEQTWDITVVSEPFTTGSEDVDTAVARLQDQARQRNWDLVVGLTELPLHDHEGRHLLVETDTEQRTAVLSLPALGGIPNARPCPAGGALAGRRHGRPEDPG